MQTPVQVRQGCSRSNSQRNGLRTGDEAEVEPVAGPAPRCDIGDACPLQHCALPFAQVWFELRLMSRKCFSVSVDDGCRAEDHRLSASTTHLQAGVVVGVGVVAGLVVPGEATRLHSGRLVRWRPWFRARNHVGWRRNELRVGCSGRRLGRIRLLRTPSWRQKPAHPLRALAGDENA